MKTVKVSELSGSALDYAVSVLCEGVSELVFHHFYGDDNHGVEEYCYSTNWLLGGPIIEREGIDVGTMRNSKRWIAQLDTRVCTGYGDTPLIAAMRCYVASKLGDKIEIPDELCKAD